MSDFATRLIRWQRQHGRHSLPWQGADAYRVWVSEIMLQQTQVATVIPYYQRFVKTFPDVAALAAASEDEVLTYWSGLGYYSRARNLHRAAQLITQRHGGEFPRDFDNILALPGIGRSTAAAICALAFRERHAILDGNVKRVLARYCAIEGYTGKKEVEQQLWQKAEALLPHSPLPPRGRMARETGGIDDSIATYTQGLMDLGATICTRTRPNCDVCPVQKNCAAFQSGHVAQLPTPRPRKVLPEKYSTFLLLLNGSDILLEKRPGSGIWGGLWCPPQFDDEAAALAWCMQRGITTDKNACRSRSCRKMNQQGKVSRGSQPANLTSQCEALLPVTHTFTHFKLHIAPLRVQVTRKPGQVQDPGRVWLDVEDALNAAIPAPVRKLIGKIIQG